MSRRFNENTREKIAAMPARFWAGVPNIPKAKKDGMAIYTCFIQHVIAPFGNYGSVQDSIST